MPLRSKYQLNREGFTADTVGRFLRGTVFNPFLTVPLWLLAKYTEKGRSLASLHLTARHWKYLKTLLLLSVGQRVSRFLDQGVTNNWTNDTYDWKREVVVVTGGSDGIGAAIVKFLAEKGIKVAVLDVQDLKYERPASVTFHKCDLTSPDSIASAAIAIRSSLGDPTVLINNAGVAFGKSILATTERDLNLTFRVNSFSHYYLVQEFLPSMITRNHGMVVTVASTAGFVVAPNMTDYASSKAAAVAFHEGLASELATVYHAPKVRTVLMCQGYTRTPLFEGFRKSDPFFAYALYPETVAQEIVKAVLAGRSRTIFLPGTMRFLVPNVRNWPEWMQYGMRKDLVKMMTNWNGRQVVQPSEAKGKEAEIVDGMEESSITVEDEGSGML